MRPGVEVILLTQERKLYKLAQSRDRVHKELAMRRRQLRTLCKRLVQLQQMIFSNAQNARRKVSHHRWVRLRYTEPNTDHKLLLQQLKLRPSYLAENG